MSALAELRSCIQLLVDNGEKPPYGMTISKRYADKLLGADVVEIVRCKDCKWYEWGMTECHNPRYGDGWANYPSPQVYDEYFCKDGERKDERK